MNKKIINFIDFGFELKYIFGSTRVISKDVNIWFGGICSNDIEVINNSFDMTVNFYLNKIEENANLFRKNDIENFH